MTSDQHPAPRRHVVVVGGGPAAHRLTEALVARLEAAPDPGALRVTVVSEEPHRPYDRVALSRRLDGPADLTLAPHVWDHPAVTLRTGASATALDPAARTVSLADGEVLGYDELVLATGSSPFVPPVGNAGAAHVYRTLEDVDGLVAELARVREREGRPAAVLVVGGGLLGLEAAGGAARLGARAAVVDLGRWLMGTQLDEGAGQALGRLVSAAGVELHLGSPPQEVLVDEGRVRGARLADGTVVEADVVVLSVGIRPRDELARAAGLALGERGGVLVDDTCATSAEHVWAVGEVAAVGGRCIGLVAPANAMAEVVADRLWGGDAAFPGVDDATRLKLAGVEVASFGDAFARSEGALEVVYADPARGLYQKLVVSADARTLLGGMFVGDASPYPALRPLVGRPLDAEPAAYLSAGGQAPAAGDLPDDAVVCSCNNVTAGCIAGWIRGEHGEPCTDLATLKACSRAGTRCGSCTPLVKRTLEAELTRAGVSVSRALCEHVALSRAELFEAVRVLGLRTAGEVMGRFASGLGCDICKPVVASVLATQTGSYILDGGSGPLQDTNDRALANLQKDGTYSVVPRVPGGEITPERLMVIAEVARDFGLYTKITGGQRIDLLGARLEQLPQIWRRLVDAGMESGHAYGKSLRTVKSCVGSAWCRYGVQDSVAMAIRLEERYRGLRSPHKIKLGVSGCARECAEARSKDVGVIATEQGWNLYVGGNGGFQPAHAQLLATDLDGQTLVRYVDRYLMYYVRTADRLQRTSRWQEELPGGLEHVREVVCEDSLGLAAELEEAMARHVDSYRDEWAATLEDPERLARFRSFVNAPDHPDPEVVMVPERGQLRPATPAERATVIAGATLQVRGADEAPGGR
ncbi:nitrite reductase large subunit NirB [Ornithinimicrobium kibberense]|uniref:nitrite reductase large subunit NirB n=1 Tax=Ornithinimicrobium kibberense TaxID=282060 RepID=UPI001143542B|nr:nitrite reductase large subunit NirB [Ornithinimicrobium kibberense]